MTNANDPEQIYLGRFIQTTIHHTAMDESNEIQH